MATTSWTTIVTVYYSPTTFLARLSMGQVSEKYLKVKVNERYHLPLFAGKYLFGVFDNSDSVETYKIIVGEE